MPLRLDKNINGSRSWRRRVTTVVTGKVQKARDTCDPNEIRIPPTAGLAEMNLTVPKYHNGLFDPIVVKKCERTINRNEKKNYPNIYRRNNYLEQICGIDEEFSKLPRLGRLGLDS